MPSQNNLKTLGHSAPRRRRGAMLVFVLICLPIVLLMAAFAIDVATMELSRTELRIATDAAARAASRTLSTSQNPSNAVAAAKTFSQMNTIMGQPLILSDADIVLGESNRTSGGGRFTFTPGSITPNSVRITARKSAGSPSGPVNLFLGGVTGIHTFEPVASSTSTQIDRDIALVIDRSGSMMFLDDSDEVAPGYVDCGVAPPLARWNFVVTATNAFLNELEATPQDEFVSLATYATDASTDLSFSPNYTPIRQRVNDLTNSFCGGSTAIGLGMLAGEVTFDNGSARPLATKVMVVLTDGVHNTAISPDIVAADFAARGIVVFTVTFSNAADEVLMGTVANLTGGKHFHAPNGPALVDAFKEIARTAANLITE